MSADNDGIKANESHICDECGAYIVNPRVHTAYHRKTRHQAANFERALATLRDRIRRLKGTGGA